jgi:hypothetical protein
MPISNEYVKSNCHDSVTSELKPQPSALKADPMMMQRRGPKRMIAQAEKMPPSPSSIPTDRLPTSAVTS